MNAKGAQRLSLVGALLIACFPLFAFGVTATSSVDDTAGEAKRVVILANAADPSSLQIAAHYAEARGVPDGNIIALPTSSEETITVDEYIKTLHNPLQNALLQRGWLSGAATGATDTWGRDEVGVAGHSISYLVVCRGVPVRMSDPDATFLPNGVPENLQSWMETSVAGSVDGELALMASPSHPISGFVPNPLFGDPKGVHAGADRIIRVSRLDGASASDVIQLIDRTVLAERTGLMGRAYIDLGGPIPAGDDWIESVGTLAAGAGFDTFIDRKKSLFGEADRRDAPAIYAGWYRHSAYGPWLDPAWAIPPGAIGFHLHSFSATTVRSPNRGWIGPLVRLGFSVTVGNVYEPSLGLTHRPQAFVQFLLQGYTWGEAVSASFPALSWQVLAIGDPLYRPFKVGLDEQLSDSVKSPFKCYAAVRKMNLLLAAGDKAEAFEFGESEMKKRPALPLAYKLAGLYEQEGENAKALKALELLRYISLNSADDLILFKEMADLQHRLGASEDALQTYKRLVGYQGISKSVRIQILREGAEIARAAGNTGLSVDWSVEAERLKPPAK